MTIPLGEVAHCLDLMHNEQQSMALGTLGCREWNRISLHHDMECWQNASEKRVAIRSRCVAGRLGYVDLGRLSYRRTRRQCAGEEIGSS